MNVLTTAATVLSLLETAGEKAPLFISTIENAVTAVEQTGKSGTDKMTSVLNFAESTINAELPQLMAKLEQLLEAIEAFVNELVAAWTAAGVFAKTVAHG